MHQIMVCLLLSCFSPLCGSESYRTRGVERDVRECQQGGQTICTSIITYVGNGSCTISENQFTASCPGQSLPASEDPDQIESGDPVQPVEPNDPDPANPNKTISPEEPSNGTSLFRFQFSTLTIIIILIVIFVIIIVIFAVSSDSGTEMMS